MASSNLPAPELKHPSGAALHQLKELPQADSAFPQALRASTFSEAAAQLARVTQSLTRAGLRRESKAIRGVVEHVVDRARLSHRFSRSPSRSR